MKKILVILLLSIVINPVTAQQKQIKKPDGGMIAAVEIDRLIKKLMDTAEVTGLCLGIINDNKIAYTKTYGYKNEKHEAIDTATVFYAASLAKPLFAYIVMQLVDKKMLSLDTPLYRYLPKPLPEYVDYKDLAEDERWKLITARHCLSHTVGFPNFRRFNPKGNNKLEMFFTPGTRYAYSGEGLELLQMIVEKITEKNLEELAQENIFKPFGMYSTSFVWQPAFDNNFSLGFDMNSEALGVRKRKRADAAGSMQTTVADYSRFLEAVMQGRGLTGASKKEMITSQIAINSKSQFPTLRMDSTGDNKAIELSYGLGWGIFNSRYGKAFFKEGHDDGWGHYCINFPGKTISILIMTNSSNGESIFKELVEKLTNTTIPWAWENYVPYKATVRLPENILQQYTGVYDGEKYQAIVSMVDGRLKIEAPKAGLPKTKLYAQSNDHFFLKVMDVQMEFVKDKDGKIEKILVVDEGEKYELKKIK